MSATLEPASPPPLSSSAGETSEPTAREAWPVAWRAFWTSRLLVLFSGVFAMLEIRASAGTSAFDPARLTVPWGYLPNLLAAPFVRWDSVWYLTISKWGYAHQTARMAFFPLYPLVMHVGGFLVGSQLLAGVLISMGAFLIALVLLYKLAALDLAPGAARLAVLLMALCPVSYYFSAIYTESLFLVLSLGCIYEARRSRWLMASALGGLAALSRNGGVVLLLPVLIIYLYGPRADVDAPLSRWAAGPRHGLRRLLPRYALRVDLCWLALIPLGLLVFLAYLGIHDSGPLAPFHAEKFWYHKMTWPFGGVWQGAVAAWDGLRQVLHGPAPPAYFAKAGGNALETSGQDLMLFGFLVLGAVAWIGGLRRLPVAYSAYTLVALALPLSDPVTPQPLSSLPRYEVVLFPFFLWGAAVLDRRRGSIPYVFAAGAVALALFTAEFATWRWVA